MKKMLPLVLSALLLAPAAVMAQQIEVSGMAGYRFSSGIGSLQIGTLPVNDVRVENGVAFTLGVSYKTSLQTEGELEWSHQSSKLTYMIGSGPTLTYGNINVDTIHAAIHMGPERAFDQKFWPYALASLGVTILGPSGASSVTRFTWTIGGGFKYWATDRFALRLEGRWMPTYLFSTDAGIWCDPYYGCWQATNSIYLQQVDISGGITYKF